MWRTHSRRYTATEASVRTATAAMARVSAQPASKPSPSAPSTSPTSSSCAAVLSFETGCGFTLTGLPISQENITPPTISRSRDTTRITSQRGSASTMPSDT